MKRFPFPLCFVSLSFCAAALAFGGVPVIPGSGALAYAYDFEEPDEFDYGTGWAGEGFGLTGTQRGAPEEIWQAAAPSGGVEGSTKALFFRRHERTPEWYALHPGAVGHRTYGQPDQENQDDFFASPRIFTAAERFSITVRVYVNLERSAQATFALRTTAVIQNTDTGTTSNHWPALWIYKVDGGDGVYSDLRAFIRTPYGAHSEYYDLPDIAGWWTLGMSFDETGDIHYFARPDSAPLSRGDYLTSASRYGTHQRFLRNLDATVFISTTNFDESEEGSIQIMDQIQIHTGGLDFYDLWAAEHFPESAFENGRAGGMAARDQDANGSGRSNFQEYLIGNDPTGAPSPFLLQAQSAEEGLDLRFPSRVDRVYTLLGSSDLHEWDVLREGINGTGDTISLQEINPTGAHFFRLRVLPSYWVGPEGL